MTTEILEKILVSGDQGNMSANSLERVLDTCDSTGYVSLIHFWKNGSWGLVYINITVGCPPPLWNSRTWSFAQVIFENKEVSTGWLTMLLTSISDDGKRLRTELNWDHEITNVAWRHQPGLARFDTSPMPWPAHVFDLYSASPEQLQTLVPPGRLIGDSDTQSFIDFPTAFNFIVNSKRSGQTDLPSAPGRLRLIHDSAYIRRLRFSRRHFEVYLGGVDIAGCYLELSTNSKCISKPVSRPAKYQFPLEMAHDPTAYLYLKRGSKWVDYVNVAFALRGDEAEHRTIEQEALFDPEFEVERYLLQGEGQTLEFKRDYPRQTSEKRNFLRSVAAFANADGGTIALGIDRDEVTVVGISDDRSQSDLRDALANLILNGLTNSPPVDDLRWLNYEGMMVLEVTIHPGNDVPYGVTLNRGDKPDYYIRHGASNVPANPQDLQALILERRSPPTATNYSVLGVGSW